MTVPSLPILPLGKVTNYERKVALVLHKVSHGTHKVTVGTRKVPACGLKVAP